MRKEAKAVKALREKDEKLKDFGDLIDTIESADEKKKFLWKQIYRNAVEDREFASVLYTQLYSSTTGSNNDHNTFGPMLVKYLERMGKCTEQLIRLAEMIDDADRNTSMPEDMYDAIQEK